MRRGLVLAGIALAAACGGQVFTATEDAGAPDTGVAPAADASAPDAALPGDAGTIDAPSPTDASLPVDGPRVDGKCLTPADCDPAWSPLSVRACPTSSWSCVVGQCTWECRGGRTCTRDGRGCLACRDGAAVETSCPGDPCVEGLLPRDGGWGGSESTCARAFVVDVVSCSGEAVPLRTGEVCTLQSLFTGAPRGVLQCGPCQTVLGP